MTPDGARSPRKLPPAVWALGLTSLFMDISSELAHSLLPVFLASVLGAGMLAIGLIEGAAEAIASLTRVLSGVLSDRRSARKPFVLFGYALSAVTKPVFPLAATIGWVAAARFADRVGKGVRTAPRDALLAGLAPEALRGAAFGLRQALDSLGALLGPLAAIAFMALLGNDIRAVLWVGVFFAFAAVVVVAAAVPESARPPRDASGGELFRPRAARCLGSGYWLLVALGAALALARFSEAFLVLRARDVGASLTFAPAVMAVMNAVYAAAAYPAGRASDRRRPRGLLLAAAGVLAAADLILAAASSLPLALAGAALWGLHMALSQGLLARLIADAAPEGLRGTAFGAYHLVTGLATLLASLIAGALWNWLGPPATFLAGAVFAALAAAGLVLFRPNPAVSTPGSGNPAARL